MSDEVFSFWSNPQGWAPDEAAKLLKDAKLNWLSDLTRCLKIWVNRDVDLTEGELLLARANIGSLVEGWLKLFYCIYFKDYQSDKDNLIDKEGNLITPNNLKFERLRQFSNNRLWTKDDGWDEWVLGVQQKRNAIHAFNDKDIGDSDTFITDVYKFYDFIRMINNKLPYPY